MTKTMIVEGVRGADSFMGSIEVEFPLVLLPDLGNVQNEIQKFINKELKKCFVSSAYYGFRSIREKPSEDCGFMFMDKRQASFFVSETELFDHLNELREIKAKAMEDRAKSVFWSNIKIDSFVLAFMFFRDCLKKEYLFSKFDFKNKTQEHYMKVGSVFFYKSSSDYTKEFFEKEFGIDSWADGGYIKDKDDFELLFQAEEIFEELLHYDVLADRGLVQRALLANKIALKYDSHLDITEDNQIVRIFRAKKEDKTVTVEFFIADRKIRAYFNEAPDNYILEAQLDEEKEDYSDFMPKLYGEKTTFSYVVYKEVFDTHLALQDEIAKEFNISTISRPKPYEIILNLSKVKKDNLENTMTQVHLKYLDLMDDSSELQKFITMLQQFILDGHTEISLFYKTNESI